MLQSINALSQACSITAPTTSAAPSMPVLLAPASFPQSLLTSPHHSNRMSRAMSRPVRIICLHNFGLPQVGSLAMIPALLLQAGRFASTVSTLTTCFANALIAILLTLPIDSSGISSRVSHVCGHQFNHAKNRPPVLHPPPPLLLTPEPLLLSTLLQLLLPCRPLIRIPGHPSPPSPSLPRSMSKKPPLTLLLHQTLCHSV